MFSKKTSNPYCQLTCGPVEHKTESKKKELNPVWNEKFRFPLTQNVEGRFLPATLRLQVYDCGWGDTAIGECEIDLNKWFASNSKDEASTRWLSLAIDKAKSRSNLGGELEVKLQYTSSSITNTSGVRHNGKDELDNERESEEDGEEEEDKKDKTKNEIEENQKTQSEIKKEMERLEQIEVKPGDYAISVHIIEVRRGR